MKRIPGGPVRLHGGAELAKQAECVLTLGVPEVEGTLGNRSLAGRVL